MEEKKWRFCVVGNIVSEHTEENGTVYYGTKAFTPGTKVYVNGRNWDHERGDVCVIGRNRFGRTVLESVPIPRLEDLRVKRIYDPHVLNMMDSLRIMDGWEWWERTADDRRDAEELVKELNRRK